MNDKLTGQKCSIFSAAFLVGALFFTTLTNAQIVEPPDSLLGYAPGERFTRHHDIVRYVEYVDDVSDRVYVTQYGETNEGRPLIAAFISSEENIARLEDIRLNNLRMTGLESGIPDADAPTIVWLSYGVHGNESSSSEAAMSTLYELVRGGSEQVLRWLDSTVVVIDPCLNPDGRDRYVNWFNTQTGRFPSANQDAREHHEPWPSGRTNHYYFDLNRDWAWLSQKESRHRVALYNQWMPQIHVDFHEQSINRPYYFAPASRPYHELITEGQRTIERLIGDNNRQYFDANDWLYFTREQFDLLYPGYGDTWPVFNGAIGMTYEQAGGGRGGLRVKNDEDHLLTLTERINHHVTSGLSTIEAAAMNRRLILDEFTKYYDAAMDGTGDYEQYVVRNTGDDNVRALADLLDGQGIRYGYASRAETVSGFNYQSGSAGRTEVQTGDLVIPASQPKSRLLTVLMEPEAALEDSITYDITAWSLPFAFNVTAVATNDAVSMTAEGPGANLLPLGDTPYAYLLPWNGLADASVLADLLTAGIRVRVSTVPFQSEGTAYEAGTIVITSADNVRHSDSLTRMVEAAAAAGKQQVTAVTSGFVDEGRDFGSGAVAYLKAPRVLVLSGSSIFSSSVGEVWHFFDNVAGYPVTLVDQDDFVGVDLHDYDVIVLPSGSYSRILGDDTMGSLSGWVRGGGKLIALESAASFLSRQEAFGLKVRDADQEADSASAEPRAYAERERDRISERITGAVYLASVDNTHPLAFGYPETYFSLKRSARAFEYLMDGWNVATIENGQPLSGFAGFETVETTTNSLLWGHESIGSGDVVYFVDNPLYRGFWHGGMLAFANAVFFVGL